MPAFDRPNSGSGGGGATPTPQLQIASLAVALGYGTSSAGDYSLGVEFYAIADCALAGAKIYKPSAGSTTIKISVYDARNPSAQVLLASKTQSCAQGWNTITLAAPVALSLSTGAIRLACYDTGGEYHAASNGSGLLKRYLPGNAPYIAAYQVGSIMVTDPTLYASGDNPLDVSGGFYVLMDPVIS